MTPFWETAVLLPLASLWRKILDFLPNLLAMAIILTVGWAGAWVIGMGVERVLRVVGFDRLSDRLGGTTALARGGVKGAPSHLVGRGVYSVLLLFTAVGALSALSLDPINRFAHSLLGYIPHVLTAILIVTAGYLLSNFVAQAVLIGAVNAGLPPARAVATLSRWGIQAVTAAMALEQLGIAQTIVVVGFGITLGGVVLAAAIAFGLGGKDLAREFLERRLSGSSRTRVPDDLRHL